MSREPVPRTILFLSATPRDAAPLRADEELREIQDVLARSRHRDALVLVPRMATRPRDVRQALLAHQPSIVHFSGHGRRAEGLLLEDDRGHSLPVTADTLAELLVLAGAQVECVLLNACHSQAYVDSIAQEVPFVIGMSRAVEDRAGIVFASAFYEALGNGADIPAAHELGCNAVRMSGLAVDDIAVLARCADTPTGRSAGVAQAQARRRRWLAAALAATALSATLCLGALAPGLGALAGLTIPAMSQGPGGIVVTVEAAATRAELDTYRVLCGDLQARAPQSVQCIELPRFGAGYSDLVQAAGKAHASLVVRVLPGQNLSLLPMSAGQSPLLASLPSIHVPGEAVSRSAAPILYALGRVLGGALDVEDVHVVPPDPELVGWRMAALAWYLAVLAGDQAVLAPRLVRGTMQRCRQEATLADVYCALAHYIYVQLEPTPPDARSWLDELLARGPAWFHDSVALELAAQDCSAAPERARAAIMHLAAAWEHLPCHRLALIGPASCLVLQHGDAAAAEPLARIAFPSDAETATCTATMRADALSERANWHMLVRRWQQAEQDFAAAWRLGGDPVDLLNWAEALLQQRERRDAGILVGSSLDLRHFQGEHRLLAAYLRWLATRADRDGALLLEFHAALPLHSAALIDDGGTLRALVCSERPATSACEVYELLRRPRGPDSVDALRRLLLAAHQ